MVRKRYFFHSYGFDPHDIDLHYRRFVREATRFAATWNVTATVSPLRAGGGDDGHWTVTAQAPRWQVESRYMLLDWSDIVRADLGRSPCRRLWQGAATFADFVATGTAGRYFLAHWRYGVFFVVPFFNILLLAAAAIAAGALAAGAMPSIEFGAVIGVAVAALMFAGLMRWLGERWRINQAVADWIFAREYMLGRRPDVAARIAAFADQVIACARRADTDEIVIAGHSLGATIVIDLLTRALDRDPALGRHGPKLCVLTIGATLPKIALHPAGAWLRDKARRVATEPSLVWAEYQARDDAIGFYKFNPVHLRRVTGLPDPGGPWIRLAQFHDMLSAATMRRLRFSFLRLHYQFVMANEQRAVYDYFMLICGPVPFDRTIRQLNGPKDLFAPDGSLCEPEVQTALP
jgi:hypothetical protein